MDRFKKKESFFTVLGFSLLSAYLLSFLFEGQVLYSLLNHFGSRSTAYIFISIIGHFLGLFFSGYFTKSLISAKYLIIVSIIICLIMTIPFFSPPNFLWLAGLIINGFVGGIGVGAWGYLLKGFCQKDKRITCSSNVLIYSNTFMIAINFLAVNISPFLGLFFAMTSLFLGLIFIWFIPIDIDIEDDGQKVRDKGDGILNHSIFTLCLFVFMVTINSGLMYQVINPSFGHLSLLSSWYWAVPYIIAILIMKRLFSKYDCSKALYLAFAMLMGAFISFMLLEAKVVPYIIINTLMMGALGILDLFWWTIIVEFIDFAPNPAKIFGIGLSANVLGILLGDIIGIAINYFKFGRSEITVIALAVLCISLVILPFLNRLLALQIKNHVFLSKYQDKDQLSQKEIIKVVKSFYPLTKREEEVLQLILRGKGNKDIAHLLFIAESTVKTHIRNIFTKYKVSNRPELISLFLKDQDR